MKNKCQVILELQPVCAANNGTVYVWGGFYENSRF